MDFSYKDGSRTYQMTVELLQRGESTEVYKVTSKRNPNKYITLSNNRPLIRGMGLKHKRLTWSVLRGEIKNTSALNAVINIIEDWIEPK